VICLIETISLPLTTYPIGLVLKINFMPVPTAGDFRIDVGNDAEKELKEEVI
jgi:hypothetical protein